MNALLIVVADLTQEPSVMWAVKLDHNWENCEIVLIGQPRVNGKFTR